MIKSLHFIILVFFVSCASRPDGKVIKKIPVTSSEEAGHVIQNKINFLNMLFEQTRDPYYGVPKWTELCLKENKIGGIQKTKHGIQAVSELYLDQSDSPGLCPENPSATKKYLVYLYCNGSESVYQILYPITTKSSELAKNLCP
jgi:hypothetical protein